MIEILIITGFILISLIFLTIGKIERWASLAGILIGILLVFGPVYMENIYSVEIPYKEGIIQGNGTNLYIHYNIYKNPEGEDDYIKTSDMICYNFTIKNKGEDAEYVNYFLKYIKIEENGNVTHHHTDNIELNLNMSKEYSNYSNKTCTIELIPAVYFLEMFFDTDEDESTTSLKSNRAVVTVLTMNDYTFIKTQRSFGFISILAGIPTILLSVFYLRKLYSGEE